MSPPHCVPSPRDLVGFPPAPKSLPTSQRPLPSTPFPWSHRSNTSAESCSPPPSPPPPPPHTPWESQRQQPDPMSRIEALSGLPSVPCPLPSYIPAEGGNSLQARLPGTLSRACLTPGPLLCRLYDKTGEGKKSWEGGCDNPESLAPGSSSQADSGLEQGLTSVPLEEKRAQTDWHPTYKFPVQPTLPDQPPRMQGHEDPASFCPTGHPASAALTLGASAALPRLPTLLLSHTHLAPSWPLHSEQPPPQLP